MSTEKRVIPPPILTDEMKAQGITHEQLLKWSRYLYTPDPFSYEPVIAAPLVQLFSVRVHTNVLDDGRPCEIYGSIQAAERQDAVFDLYTRDISEPEVIKQHDGALSLIGPEGVAILGVTRAGISLCLRDRIRDIELIKGEHILDPTVEGIEDSYDKLLKAVIQGQYGSAYLYYTTFRFAVSATVEVRIIKKDQCSHFANIHGSIVASYGNARRYCSNDDELKYLETVLFEKPSDQPQLVIAGTNFKLSRSVVVVPAYSSLVIKADLHESQEQFAGVFEVPADDSGKCTKCIEGDNASVEVEIGFHCAYPQIYKDCIRDVYTGRPVGESIQLRQRDDEELSKKARVVPTGELHSSSDLVGTLPQTETNVRSTIGGGDLVEFISLYIGGFRHDVDVSAVSGMIEIDDSIKRSRIISRDTINPEFLSDDKLACVEVHTPIRNAEFSVDIHLKDPIQNLEVSEGWFCWNVGTLEWAHSLSWFNRHICSVLRGADGYAALHYMIFDSAVQAVVDVTFFCEDYAGVPTKLHGLLLNRYGGHEYSTDYEKKYYQSRLFNKPLGKGVDVSPGSKVALLKSIVAVPLNSSLIIEANLRAICNGKSQAEPLNSLLEFAIDPSGATVKEIRGQSCWIEVSVTFKDSDA